MSAQPPGLIEIRGGRGTPPGAVLLVVGAPTGSATARPGITGADMFAGFAATITEHQTTPRVMQPMLSRTLS